MMVIPMKWFPWLILIVGVITLAGGEAETGFVMVAVGGIWLFLRSQSKNKGSAGSSSQSAPSAGTIDPPPKQPSQTVQTGQGPQAKQHVSFCPVCGARANSGAAFCMSCGTKLTQ